MKILLVCNYGFTYQKYLHPLALNLKSQGHEVVAAFCEKTFNPKSSYICDQYKPILMPRKISLLGLLSAFCIFRSAVKLVNPDLVIYNNRNASLVARIGMLFSGLSVKKVYFARGMYFHDAQQWLNYSLSLLAEYIFYFNTSGTISQSSEDVVRMSRLPFVSSNKFFVVHNGIDQKKFRFYDRDFNFDSEIKLVSVGRLVPEKGFLDVVQAIKFLEQRGINATYTVVGGHLKDITSIDDDWFLSEVRRLKMSHRVKVTGFVDDVEQFLVSAHVLIQSSHREGFPRAILEGMSSGLIVIATDIRGARELSESGNSCYLYPRGNYRELARRIAQIHSMTKAQLMEIGRSGRDRVESYFNEDLYVERQAAAISSICRAL